ncbi:MAG: extracellular solute-binding protein [Gemmatimonadaceae bacterium]
MRTILPAVVLLLSACTEAAPSRRAPADTLIVYAAASLSAPLRTALDSFARRTGAVVLEEHGASLELARRITELHRVPDVIALADQEVFPELLMPSVTSWYSAFARNRMVIAYTDRSRHAADIRADNWWKVVLRDDVLLGRTDPLLAPAGYRTLLLYALAEATYHERGLSGRLTAKSPPRLMRGNAAELAALLSAGELDYIVEYESLARAQHFRFIELPPQLHLGDPAFAAEYAKVRVQIGAGGDTVTRRGAPILYGLSVPRSAPHADVGARFVQFLLGAEGRASLRAQNVDALDEPIFVGDSIPALVRATTP